MVQLQQKKDARAKEEHSTPNTIHHRLGQTGNAEQSLSTVSDCPLNIPRDEPRGRRIVVTDQVDKNFIADLLVLLVILVVVVGGFGLLHTPAILLGGGLALVVAVAAEFAWSR